MNIQSLPSNRTRRRLGQLALGLFALVLAATSACTSGDRTGTPSEPGIAPNDTIPEGYANQVIAKVDAALLANPAQLTARVAELGAEVAYLDHSTQTAWVRPAAGTVTPLAQLLSQVATVPGVVDVRFDPVVYGAGRDKLKKKPGKACSEGQSDPSGPSMWHLAAMRVAAAWDRQPSAAPLVVAVLDTGLTVGADGSPEAPGLQDVPVVDGYDFVGIDDDPSDDNGHGTLVTSLVAAEGEYPGVAPGVTVMPVKVLGDARRGSEAALTAGINFAVEAGADVISMSLAFSPGFVPSGDLAIAISDAAEAGVVMLAATGNHGGAEVSYPAAFGEVIAVGGVRLTEPTQHVSLECALAKSASWIAKKTDRAEYSGFGAAIDICAPGGSMDHDLDGDGLPDAVPAISFDPATPGNYEPFLVAGTSPATAEVSGLAALLLAGGAAPADVRPLLQNTAIALGDAGFSTACGNGLADGKFSLKRLEQGKVPEVPERFVNPVVTLAEDGAGNRRAIAFVEVVDADNQPVAGVTVVGHFRGAVVHDVMAVTDADGHVLMTSLAARSDATMFEFGVDKILETGCAGEIGKQTVVVVPQSFARFELASFRVMSSFMASGAGVEPSPFSIFIDPDALAPLLSDFGDNMVTGPDPSLPVDEPVSTIPPDIASWTLVESLTTRNLGADVAPLTIALDRNVLKTECSISDDILPIYSMGSGIEPSPWRLNDALIRDDITLQQVIVQPGQLFLDGQPTTETELGLYFGDEGQVVVDVDGSICTPPSIYFGDINLWSDPVLDGQAASVGGFSITVVQAPDTHSGPIDYLEDTAAGSAQCEAAFATSSSLNSEASAAVEGAGCGLQPLP